MLRRRLLAALVPLAAVPLVLVAPAPATAGPTFPDRIDLPDGFAPEGIEAGRGTTFYVGSLATGDVVRGDARTGVVEPFADAPAAPTVGLHFDERTGLLWAAGGPSGTVTAYDGQSGALVRRYSVAGAGFLNDVAVAGERVFVTDSQRQQLVVLPRDASGEASLLPLTGDFRLVQGFNANGIVAARGGTVLVLVQSATGFLFTVDPATGATRRIDTGGAVFTNGDGLELVGSTLYVVENRDELVSVVRLSGKGALTGRKTGELTAADLDVPTTAAAIAGSLYAVNARFGTPVTPTTDFWVTRLRR